LHLLLQLQLRRGRWLYWSELSLHGGWMHATLWLSHQLQGDAVTRRSLRRHRLQLRISGF
jgi:hypothetical protein